MPIKPNCIYCDGFVKCNCPDYYSKFLFWEVRNACVLFEGKISCPYKVEKCIKPNIKPGPRPRPLNK